MISTFHGSDYLSCKTSSADDFLDEFLELLRCHAANRIVHDLTVLEEKEIRNGHDSVSHDRVAVLIYIELAEFHLAVKELSHLVNYRAHHLARTAPVSVAVQKDRELRFKDFIFKCIRCNFYYHIIPPSLTPSGNIHPVLPGDFHGFDGQHL